MACTVLKYETFQELLKITQKNPCLNPPVKWLLGNMPEQCHGELIQLLQEMSETKDDHPDWDDPFKMFANLIGDEMSKTLLRPKASLLRLFLLAFLDALSIFLVLFF